MLMSAHDGAVDHRIFIVSLCGEVLEHAFPNAGDGPAAEASLHLDPIPKTLRQITPGNPGPIAVEHSFDKHPVVPRRHTNRSRTAGQKVSDPLPLIVTQPVASHRSAPNTLTDSESKFVTPWNPQMTTRHSWRGHQVQHGPVHVEDRDVPVRRISPTDSPLLNDPLPDNERVGASRFHVRQLGPL